MITILQVFGIIIYFMSIIKAKINEKQTGTTVIIDKVFFSLVSIINKIKKIIAYFKSKFFILKFLIYALTPKSFPLFFSDNFSI